MVKSRMQGLGASKYRNALHCVQDIVQNEGFLALYKGIGPRMARVCCEARLVGLARLPGSAGCVCMRDASGHLLWQVAITMTLYGEVVKVLNKYWITTDQKPGSRPFIRGFSVLTESKDK